MAQITSITSEALQATIRRLLPSQVGFGEDLQASNVILPVIDLTPTAEGSQLRGDLQSASSFGSITSFDTQGTVNTLINTAGFYRIEGAASVRVSSGGLSASYFLMNDGTTDKVLWSMTTGAGIDGEIVVSSFDLIVFLRSGDSLKAGTDSNCVLRGSFRQIADVYGNIVNPSGFTFE